MPSNSRTTCLRPHEARGLLLRPSVLKQTFRHRFITAQRASKRRPSEATCNLVISHDDMISSLDTHTHTYRSQVIHTYIHTVPAVPLHDGASTVRWRCLSPACHCHCHYPQLAFPSLPAVAHLSICDTRHGCVAGRLGERLEAVSGGEVDAGSDPCQVRAARRTVRRDYLISMRMDCLPIVPALPCLSFLGQAGQAGREEGRPAKDAMSTKDTFLRGACGHRPSSVRLQKCPIRPPDGPRQHAGAGKPGKQLAHDSSCIVALGRRPSCPIGRGVDHLMCPAAQVTAIGWNRQRGYRTKWRLIMAHSDVPYTPGQPG